MDPGQTREILRKVRQLEIRTNRYVTDSLVGHYHSVFKGRGMNFDEVREYIPGDDVRMIDWNVTARAGRPFVKKFIEERELTLLLLVDVSASGTFGSAERSKRELAAELASVLAFSALRNNDKVGLILFSDQIEHYIPPKKGRRHALRVVRDILYFQPIKRGTSLDTALNFADDITARRAVLFLISDFQFADPVSQLKALRRSLRRANRRHDVVAARIHDPHEAQLPNVGLLAIEDAETGELVEIDTRKQHLRERFEELARQQYASLHEAFTAEAVDHFSVSTAKPYLSTLIAFFQGRERRRK
jgi:uncharacterized protein (DUF58 family)